MRRDRDQTGETSNGGWESNHGHDFLAGTKTSPGRGIIKGIREILRERAFREKEKDVDS